MSFSAIVAGVFAIAKAVPIVAEYIEKFYSMYVTHEIHKIEKTMEAKKQERRALMKAISKADTNEERKALSIILNDHLGL